MYKNRCFLILYKKNIVFLYDIKTFKYDEILKIYFSQTGHTFRGYGQYFLATKCSGTNTKG